MMAFVRTRVKHQSAWLEQSYAQKLPRRGEDLRPQYPNKLTSSLSAVASA
jgi:hypothetical protein